MTVEEISDLVTAIGVKHLELTQVVDEIARKQLETDRQLKETDRQLKETDRQLKETDRHLQETDRQVRETDRIVRELGKQIGGMADKFGSFTEGLALPSMTKILTERFGMTFIASRVRKRLNGRSLEVDVMAYSNSGSNEVYLVEVKSHLREEALEQMRRTLRTFREFFPEHADKRAFGIIAAVDGKEEIRKKVLAEGFYLARIHDEEFTLDVPDSFQPRAY